MRWGKRTNVWKYAQHIPPPWKMGIKGEEGAGRSFHLPHQTPESIPSDSGTSLYSDRLLWGAFGNNQRIASFF